MLRYYKLGSSKRKPEAYSTFIVHIQQQNITSQLSITDISGSNPDQITKLAKNNTTVFTSISHIEDMDLIKNTLEATSGLYRKQTGTHPESDDYLRQTILNMTNEINSLRSHSRVSLQSDSSLSEKAYSTFSSISGYTNITLPTDDEKDTHYQLEDLQNQLAATRARNTCIEHELNNMVSHTSCLENLLSVQDKLIVCLEGELGNGIAGIKRGMYELGLDRDDLCRLWDTFKKIGQGDTGDIEEEEHVKSLLNDQGAHDQQEKLHSQLKERQLMIDKIQHSHDIQIARCKSLERRTCDLQQELSETREMLKNSDVSGMIDKLEGQIMELMRQKQAGEDDFIKSYEDALNEIQSMKRVMDSQNETIDQLKSTSQSLHQQLKQPDSRRDSCSNSIISVYGQYNQLEETPEDTDKDELIKSLSIENNSLRSSMAEMQSQRAKQNRNSLKQIVSLESEVAKLTASKGDIQFNTKSHPPASRIPPLTSPPKEPIPPLPQVEKNRKPSKDDGSLHLHSKD